MRTYKWITSTETLQKVVKCREVKAESFDEAYALAAKVNDGKVMITGSKELV